MATYFDNFHSVFVRMVPNFRLLKVRPHKTDPRAATSVVIAGMTLGLALVVILSLTPPVVRPTAPSKSGGVVAPPPAADKVTIVAATPRDVPNLDVPCTEQTWPYIDRRCLTETTQKRPQPQERTREAATAPIDPLKATGPVAPAAVSPPPAVAETQGVASREAAIRPGAVDMQPPRTGNDSSEEAELAEDAEVFPVLSPREQRRLERMERQRAGQERRLRHPHLQLPIFGRVF